MSPPLESPEVLAYLRSKINQLLEVIGTQPLRPEELDDEHLIALDPIGIVADSFRQILAHLNETNARLEIARNEIRTVFDKIGAAVVVLDMEDRIEDCNQLASEWFFDGNSGKELVGRLAHEVCHCAESLGAVRAVADGNVHAAVIDGRDVQVVATRIHDDAGQPAKTVMLFTDISAQKQTERRLRLYGKVFSHVGEGILITDAARRIVETNQAVSRITGYAREELIGRSPALLKSGLHDPAFYDNLWKTVSERGWWHGEIHDRRKDGEVVPVLQSISEVRDDDGRLSHYIAVMTDISSLKETQTRLDFLAHHDALTELPNRLLFGDRLRHAIERARREKRSLALLFIDLDRFKGINDTLGHHVGDLVLIETAHRLKRLVRRADTAARLGGDEFVVLMETSVTPATAAGLAQKIDAAFQRPFEIEQHELRVGCSIGVALFPEDGVDAATLMKNADAAMYRVKQARREARDKSLG